MIPFGTLVRLHKRGEDAVNRYFKIPEPGEVINGAEIKVDYSKVAEVLIAVSNIAATIARYHLSKLEKRKLSEEDFKKYKSLLLIQKYDIPEGAGPFLEPSPYVEEFYKDYIVEIADASEELRLKITQEMDEAMRKGLSIEETKESLKSLLGEFQGRAYAIARTETTRALNYGALMGTYESEIVKGYEFIAVMDRRTTPICEARNGRIFSTEDRSLLAANTPPLHVNCRSVLDVVTIYDKEAKPFTTQKEMDTLVEKNPEIASMARPQDTERVETLLKALR